MPRTSLDVTFCAIPTMQICSTKSEQNVLPLSTITATKIFFEIFPAILECQ